MTPAETIRRLRLVHRYGSCRDISVRCELLTRGLIERAVVDRAFLCLNGVPQFNLTDAGMALIRVRP